MRGLRLLVGALVAFLGTAAAAAQPVHGQLVLPLPRIFVANLSGSQEVPAVFTPGRGFATFDVEGGGAALEFSLSVFNLQNITAAHIHCGPPGVNGPIVVFLFGPAAPPVTEQGQLSEGTITEAEIITVSDSAACPGGVSSLAELLDQMRRGNTYVNVHTTAHPGGEIRGQIH